MKTLVCGIRVSIAVLAVWFAGTAGAQENLDRGKTPAQLFASDCAICHKTVNGLSKNAGLFGLDSFLREHYTASRESAAAISAYIQAMDRGAPPAPVKRTKRTAKGADSKGSDKKAAARPGEQKSGGSKGAETKSGDSKPAESKPAEAKPAEAKAEAKPEPKPESKPAEAKAVEPKASEPKPAPDAKPDKKSD